MPTILREHIVEKAPSPDLIPGVIDEDLLGINYEKLDMVLSSIENNRGDLEIMVSTGITGEEIRRVKELMSASEYLRTWPVELF